VTAPQRTRTGRVLTCRIPATPHKLLNPNTSRISQAERAKLDWPLPMKTSNVIKFALRRELREATMLAAMNDRPAKPMAGPVVLRFVIAYERGRKVLDFDNAIATLKGAIDGLVDAGYMRDDDQVTGIYLEQIKDPAGQGYIDVCVEPVSSERIA